MVIITMKQRQLTRSNFAFYILLEFAMNDVYRRKKLFLFFFLIRLNLLARANFTINPDASNEVRTA